MTDERREMLDSIAKRGMYIDETGLFWFAGPVQGTWICRDDDGTSLTHCELVGDAADMPPALVAALAGHWSLSRRFTWLKRDGSLGCRLAEWVEWHDSQSPFELL